MGRAGSSYFSDQNWNQYVSIVEATQPILLCSEKAKLTYEMNTLGMKVGPMRKVTFCNKPCKPSVHDFDAMYAMYTFHAYN